MSAHRGHIRERRGKLLSLEVRVKPRGGGKAITRTIRAKDTSRAAERAAYRAAKAKLAELLVQADEGRFAGPEAGTVDDLVTRWLAHNKPTANKKGWEDRTYDSYVKVHRLYIAPHLGRMPIERVDAAMLDAHYADLQEHRKKITVVVDGVEEVKEVGPIKPATAAKVHVVLSGAFKQAVKWKMLRSSPVRDATSPSQRSAKIVPPTAAEVRLLFATAAETDPDFAALLRVLADTGCRRGEVAALRWAPEPGDEQSWVDLEAGEILFAEALAHTGGTVIAKDTKTHQIRRVSITPGTVTALRAVRARWAERALAVGAPIPGPVFASVRHWGKPIQPDSITQHFGRVRKRAGLPHVRLHGLRHFAVTTALSNNVDQVTVMGRTGHATLASLSRYSHFVPAADRAAADVMAAVLGE